MTRIAIERDPKDNTITARGIPIRSGNTYFCFTVKLLFPDDVIMTDEQVEKLWREEFESAGAPVALPGTVKGGTNGR